MQRKLQFWTGAPAFLAALFLTSLAFAQIQVPDLTGRVVDNANMLPAVEEAQVDEMLRVHEEQTGNQVVVVTLQSLDGRTIEEFGVELGRAWGIGQAGQDNGVLLIVAPNERQVRIEVGYGLEGDLTDAQASGIIQNAIIPEFRTGDRVKGIVDGVRAILETLEEDASTVTGIAPDKQKFALPPIIIFFIFIAIVMSLRSFGRHSKRYTRASRRMSGWSSGGGFSGGSSGGFSGGGGSFGGGGSSGSW